MLQPIARFARIADQESKRWRMKRLCKVVHEVVTSDVCCNLGCANAFGRVHRNTREWVQTIKDLLYTGVPVPLTRLHLLCVTSLHQSFPFPFTAVSDNRRPVMSKTSLDFRRFPATSIKNLKNWRFLPFTLSGPLSKQTVIVCNCDLCLVDFDPAFCVSRFVAFEL